MKKHLYIGFATFLAALPLAAFIPTPALAAPGSIRQNIFPLECVFQVVNDGSNTVIYITPDECNSIFPPDPEPVDPEDPDTEPNPTDPTSPANPVDPGDTTFIPPTRIQTGTGIIQTPGIRIPSSFEAAQQLPFEPVAVLQSVEEAQASQGFTATSTVIAAVVVALTAIGLIILIAFA